MNALLIKKDIDNEPFLYIIIGVVVHRGYTSIVHNTSCMNLNADSC